MSPPAAPPRRGPARGRARSRVRTAVEVGCLVLVWAVVAVPAGLTTFLNSSRHTVLASHDAVVRPTFAGWAEIGLGPVLPSFRYPTGGRIGADIELGKTSLTSYEALVQRYAFLASQPESQIAKVEGAIVEMARDAALVGALAGLALPAVWLLLGARRRRELFASPRTAAATTAGVVVSLAVVTAVVVRPWERSVTYEDDDWQPLAQALPDVAVPPAARPLEVDSTLLTRGTQRLVESALNSYRTSSRFYASAAEEAATLELRQPVEGETVGVLVSDRHDNIGMDAVARAIADVGGATFLLDAGDDTSTGSEWEAFSLESLAGAFSDYDHRFFVAGNHDNGTFLPEQADRLGFTVLDGEVVEGPDDLRILGVADPRSSGLGNWRDETGLSFDDVAERIGEVACAADEDGERVSTILVHDANLGDPALEAGCADLVVAGHLHVVVGPDEVEGENGEVGYSFTTGTTGGAAYAIAIGTKPRRDATVSLVTYRDGRPRGIQVVSLSPLGDFTVQPWTPLELDRPAVGPLAGRAR